MSFTFGPVGWQKVLAGSPVHFTALMVTSSQKPLLIMHASELAVTGHLVLEVNSKRNRSFRVGANPRFLMLTSLAKHNPG